MRTRQWIQAILVLFLGLYLFDTMLSGRIAYYINERFNLFSWAAVIILLTMGVTSVVDLMREQRQELDTDHKHHGHEHDHVHDHQHGTAPKWPVLFILALPLLLGIMVPAKPLGASAIGNNGVGTGYSSIQGTAKTTQFSVASEDRNVLDWVRAFNSTSNVDEFNGQRADVIGFVYRDIRFKENSQFMLARFTVSCCVADASALGILIQTNEAHKFAQDSWVHVKGKFQVQTFDGQRTPILVADTVELTQQPAHPYLYP